MKRTLAVLLGVVVIFGLTTSLRNKETETHSLEERGLKHGGSKEVEYPDDLYRYRYRVSFISVFSGRRSID